MSGITSLIDTLMHQVLGKRVDTAPPRDLNQPVKPTSPAEAARAVRSDSRLEGRAGTQAAQPGANTRAGANAGGAMSAGSLASSQTHFSPAGRSIANLIALYPAPRSSLVLPGALLSAGETPDPANVATRLMANLRDSGLFYEAHLRQWHNGTASRQQLEREPQMLRFQQQGQPPATVLAGHSPEPIDEALEGIVRHQIEMLASPAIRWEGDAWSGIFLALLIQPAAERGEPGEDAEDAAAEDQPWHTEIELDLRAGGRLKAGVTMAGDNVTIDVRASNPGTLRDLEDSAADLHARLSKQGFDGIDVFFSQLLKGEPDEPE